MSFKNLGFAALGLATMAIQVSCGLKKDETIQISASIMNLTSDVKTNQIGVLLQVEGTEGSKFVGALAPSSDVKSCSEIKKESLMSQATIPAKLILNSNFSGALEKENRMICLWPKNSAGEIMEPGMSLQTG